MNKIIKINEAIKIARGLKKQNKVIVVAGGFFDILHTGHIKFLEIAKRHGDCLFVLLEDDKKAKKIKGANRPINPQKDRAKILSALGSVDYVILLGNMTNDTKYDRLIIQMMPDVIAATYGDPYIKHKKRQARLINGRVACVIKKINNYSTTLLTKNI
jgi:rfaE bifunctional protein nucleotidyltransferase chain/domain